MLARKRRTELWHQVYNNNYDNNDNDNAIYLQLARKNS